MPRRARPSSGGRGEASAVAGKVWGGGGVSRAASGEGRGRAGDRRGRLERGRPGGPGGLRKGGRGRRAACRVYVCVSVPPPPPAGGAPGLALPLLVRPLPEPQPRGGRPGAASGSDRARARLGRACAGHSRPSPEDREGGDVKPPSKARLSPAPSAGFLLLVLCIISERGGGGSARFSARESLFR